MFIFYGCFFRTMQYSNNSGKRMHLELQKVQITLMFLLRTSYFFLRLAVLRLWRKAKFLQDGRKKMPRGILKSLKTILRCKLATPSHIHSLFYNKPQASSAQIFLILCQNQCSTRSFLKVSQFSSPFTTPDSPYLYRS